jgi:hypothetical protein
MYETKNAVCRFCGWTWTFPDTPDYNSAVDNELSRHIENVHGFISVLKHEYELHNAIESAYRRGVDEGRQMLNAELTKVVERAIGNAKISFTDE